LPCRKFKLPDIWELLYEFKKKTDDSGFEGLPELLHLMQHQDK